MLMLCNCVICSNCFDNISPVSVLSCGHLYHSKCIQEWLALSRNCPDCRRTLRASDVKRAYPNLCRIDDETSIIADLMKNLSDKDNEINSLKNKNDANMEKLSDKDNEINSLKNENEDIMEKLNDKDDEINSLKNIKEAIMEHIKHAEGEIHAMNQTNRELKQYLQDANLKIREVETQYHMVQREAAEKDKELMLYQNIKKIVDSRAEDVKLILEGRGKSDDIELATYCSVLKQELEQSKMTKNQPRAKVSPMNDLENGQLRRKYKALKQRFLHLRKEKANSCQNLGVPCHPNPFFLNSGGGTVTNETFSDCTTDDSTTSVKLNENKPKTDHITLDSDESSPPSPQLQESPYRSNPFSQNRSSASATVTNETVGIRDNSPIAARFDENEREIELIVLDDEESLSTPGTSSNTIQDPIFSLPGPISQEESVTGIGNDGYGGHGRFVMRFSPDATRRTIDSPMSEEEISYDEQGYDALGIDKYGYDRYGTDVLSMVLKLRRNRTHRE